MEFVDGKGFILSQNDVDAMRAETFLSDLSAFDAVTSDLPSLSAPSTIDSILRNLILMVAEGRAAELNGEKDRAAIIREIQSACRVAQDVLYGKDLSYKATSWNSPDHLGLYLVGVVGVGDDASDAVFRVLSNFIADTIKVIADHELEKITESQMESAVDGLLETYRRLLMGLPPE